MIQLRGCICALIFAAILRQLGGAPDNQTEPTESATSERVYGLRKCSGSGCPYAASWLAHVNLYRRIPWWLDTTKMEAASFNVFDRSKLKFQLLDPDAYYVHHMSAYEHHNHKAYGFTVANNKTLLMSRAAFHGECDGLEVSKSKEYLALIPFYGGRPPGVTKDLAVKSIGQGNSLVDSYTKGLQTMAAVCSCLKYYGHALIGVARDEDRVLLNDMLQSKLSPEALRRTNVVQFSMPKPAHLPFHLLAWGQRYVQTRNCAAFYNPADQMALGMVAGGGAGAGAAGGGKGVGVEVQGRLLAEAGTNASHSIVGSGNRTIGSGSTGGTGDTGGMYIRATGGVGGTSVGGAGGRGKFPTQDMLDSILKERTVDPGKVPQNELFDICRARGVVGSIGGPVKVVYMRKWDFGLGGHRRGHGQSQGQDRGQRQTQAEGQEKVQGQGQGQRQEGQKEGQGEGQERSRRKLPPIKFIYYTESDQVVRFDSPATLAALSSASNESCFFVGKRREKSRDTDPAQYMSGLNSWRECGVPGYSLSWPKHTHVQLD